MSVLRWKKIGLWAMIAGVATLGVGLLVADYWVMKPYRRKCYQSAEEIRERYDVALLLGTGKFLRSGYENPMYRYRIQAAASLYLSGKVNYILASGDNGRRDYDEPSQMTFDLMDAGVPFEAIYRDYAGFRTLDSVVRAQKVFGLREFIVVSQPFHNERALYLANASGVRAIGFNAQDVPFEYALKTRVREKFARLAAVLDVHVLHRQPKFLGDPIQIGVSKAP
jgi:SanA protein